MSGSSLMLRSLLLQFQVERKVKSLKSDVALLEITVHAEFSLRWNRFIRMDFNVKSIIFRPRFAFANNFFFLILAMFLS